MGLGPREWSEEREWRQMERTASGRWRGESANGEVMEDEELGVGKGGGEGAGEGWERRWRRMRGRREEEGLEEVEVEGVVVRKWGPPKVDGEGVGREAGVVEDAEFEEAERGGMGKGRERGEEGKKAGGSRLRRCGGVVQKLELGLGFLEQTRVRGGDGGVEGRRERLESKEEGRRGKGESIRESAL